jgi:hypothetical protein
MEITAEVTKTSTGRASLERVNTKRYAILSSIAKLVRDSNIASSDAKDRIIMAMTTTSPVNVLAGQERKDLLQKTALSGSTGQLTRRTAWRKTRGRCQIGRTERTKQMRTTTTTTSNCILLTTTRLGSLLGSMPRFDLLPTALLGSNVGRHTCMTNLDYS